MWYCLIVLDEPSVFKASESMMREEVRGAEEIAEDENTAVELPIDQVHLSSSVTSRLVFYKKKYNFREKQKLWRMRSFLKGISFIQTI